MNAHLAARIEHTAGKRKKGLVIVLSSNAYLGSQGEQTLSLMAAQDFPCGNNHHSFNAAVATAEEFAKRYGHTFSQMSFSKFKRRH